MSDASKQLGDRAHRFAAKTPEGEARQRANLEIARERGGAALKHGLHSPTKLRAAREAILSELCEAFPAVRRDRLQLAAAARARVQLGHDYLDQRGDIIAHRKRGTVVPVVGLIARAEASYLTQLEQIEALQREAGAGGEATATAAWVRYARGEGPRPDDEDDQEQDADVVDEQDGTA